MISKRTKASDVFMTNCYVHFSLHQNPVDLVLVALCAWSRSCRLHDQVNTVPKNNKSPTGGVTNTQTHAYYQTVCSFCFKNGGGTGPEQSSYKCFL